MNDIEWLSENEFCLRGVKFLCSLDDYARQTDDQRVVILKDRSVLENYAEVFDILENSSKYNAIKTYFEVKKI